MKGEFISPLLLFLIVGLVFLPNCRGNDGYGGYGDRQETKDIREQANKPTIIPTEGGVSLPFKNPRLKAQIETVIKSFDETGKPPAGVWQGHRRGHPVGRFLNDRNKLPSKPLGYYTESDIWPGKPGNRASARLIFGKGGEIYYTPDHYKTFVRIR
jgi:hypothetical protein